jgi:hypothetical protein
MVVCVARAGFMVQFHSRAITAADIIDHTHALRFHLKLYYWRNESVDAPVYMYVYHRYIYCMVHVLVYVYILTYTQVHETSESRLAHCNIHVFAKCCQQGNNIML